MCKDMKEQVEVEDEGTGDTKVISTFLPWKTRNTLTSITQQLSERGSMLVKKIGINQ